MLTRAAVVAAAVATLDETGLESLSMRTVAGRLGTSVMSLYWHVPTKDALLDLVLDEVVSQVEVPAVGADWRQDLREVAHGIRRVLLAHRDVARLVPARPMVSPGALRIVEFLLASLRGAGFADETVPLAYNLILNYVIGSVLLDVSSAPPGTDGAEAADRPENFFDAVPLDQFPSLAALGGLMFAHSEDQRFVYGLNSLIDGLASQLSPGAGSSRSRARG